MSWRNPYPTPTPTPNPNPPNPIPTSTLNPNPNPDPDPDPNPNPDQVYYDAAGDVQKNVVSDLTYPPEIRRARGSEIN